MSSLLAELADAPSAAMLDGLRGLERKTSLVFTLLKASVYSIVLNQQIQEGDWLARLGGDGSSAPEIRIGSISSKLWIRRRGAATA